MQKCVIAAAILVAGAMLVGCRKPVFFPAESLSPAAEAAGAGAAYDTDGDGKADFFTCAGPDGRIDRIAYDNDGDQKPDTTINLDEIPFSRCRHLVIILDGFGYELVKQYYNAGGLRMFHRPSRVIAPYPTLTDVCMEDILGYIPCRGFEALYFDRLANKLTGGAGDYLAGKSAPYNRLLHYRADLIWDAIGYIAPWKTFGKEVNDAKRVFDKAETQEMLAYFVSSAGVSTTAGAAGQRKCLGRIEQLVNQVIWQTRGLTKVTLLADHGHSYTPAERIPLERHLRKKGWHLRKSLRGPDDVVYVRFGLETYASFATNRPAALAGDLIVCEGVELASYADGDNVVVLAPNGARAVINCKAGRYRYKPSAGDPLKLKPVLGDLQSDKEGYYDAEQLVRATVTHVYPAPLQRLWRAHFALVENAPDVIISLEDRFYSGSKSFAGSVDVASTHGSLNYSNSATFIMSTAGALPAAMRSADIPGYMKNLTGRPWPTGR